MSDSTKQNRWREMPPKRREQYWRIFDNYQPQSPIWHDIFLCLGYLHDHFPDDKIDAALSWLINSNMVGIRFMQWYNSGCQRSNLNMHASLLSVVENQKVTKIIAGKNFKV